MGRMESNENIRAVADGVHNLNCGSILITQEMGDSGTFVANIRDVDELQEITKGFLVSIDKFAAKHLEGFDVGDYMKCVILKELENLCNSGSVSSYDMLKAVLHGTMLIANIDQTTTFGNTRAVVGNAAIGASTPQEIVELLQITFDGVKRTLTDSRMVSDPVNAVAFIQACCNGYADNTIEQLKREGKAPECLSLKVLGTNPMVFLDDRITIEGEDDDDNDK